MECPDTPLNGELDSVNRYEIALRPLSWFRQSEHVDPGNVKFLAETIVRAGHWLEPIIVEKSCGIVMDGNHRLNAALELGLKRVPCIQLEYGDPRVCVRHWRTGYHFEVAHIFRTIAQGEIFPTRRPGTNSIPRCPSYRCLWGSCTLELSECSGRESEHSATQVYPSYCIAFIVTQVPLRGVLCTTMLLLMTSPGIVFF